jgi:hypothetical protein
MTSKKPIINLKGYKLYCLNDDFLVLARTDKEAYDKLQEFWKPCNDGLGQILQKMAKKPAQELIKGFHLVYLKTKGRVEIDG